MRRQGWASFRPDERRRHHGFFMWWDDAVAIANARAAQTGQRQRVERYQDGWRIVDARPHLELAR